MSAETVIVSVILFISAAPLIILGIVQYRSERPVGFWSGEKPPEKDQITDMKAYNQKHGLMWILYGSGFLLCFAGGAAFGEVAATVLCMAEVLGGIVGVILYHNKLNRRYRKKEGDM